MRFKDQHIDIFARFVYPITYIVVRPPPRLESSTGHSPPALPSPIYPPSTRPVPTVQADS